MSTILTCNDNARTLLTTWWLTDVWSRFDAFRHRLIELLGVLGCDVSQIDTEWLKRSHEWEDGMVFFVTLQEMTCVVELHLLNNDANEWNLALTYATQGGCVGNNFLPCHGTSEEWTSDFDELKRRLDGLMQMVDAFTREFFDFITEVDEQSEED